MEQRIKPPRLTKEESKNMTQEQRRERDLQLKREYSRLYYNANKQAIVKNHFMEKTRCDVCNMEMLKCNLREHNKTKRHKKMLLKQDEIKKERDEREAKEQLLNKLSELTKQLEELKSQMAQRQ